MAETVGEKRAREETEVIEILDDTKTDTSQVKESDILKKREQFKRFYGEHPWIRDSGYLAAPKGAVQKSYEDVWVNEGILHCKACVTSINVGSNTGNIGKHATTTSHKTKVQEKTGGGNQIGMNHYTVPAPAKGRKLSPQETLEKAECIHNLRVVTHALALSYGVNPTEMEVVLGPHCLLKDATKSLEAESTDIATSESVISKDFEKAEELLDNAIKKLLGTDPIAVGVDGTSMRHKKIQIVVLHTLRCKPLLVDVIFPEDEEDFALRPVYDWDRAAPHVLSSLERFGVEKSEFQNRVTCLVADNTASQPRLARALGIAHGKCGAHAVHLSALGLCLLHDFRDLVIGLGSLVNLGGGFKRKVSLEAANLQPRSIQTYAGRFGSSVTTAKYDLDNFARLKEWVQKNLHANTQDEIDEDVDNDDILEDDDGDTVQVKISKTSTRVLKAWTKKTAVVTLKIVDLMFKDLPVLVKDLSGEGDSVPTDILNRLTMFEKSFAEAKNNPDLVSLPALKLYNVLLTPVELAAMNKNIQEVAQEALEKLQKHMPPYKNLLTHRFRYSPRKKPEPLPKDTKFYKPFIGCVDANMTVGMVTEYKAYVEEVTNLHDNNESDTVDTYKFWNSKREIWPNLTPVALYHLTFPVGNISAERGCGQLRHIESNWTRSQQSHDTIRREAKFKYNKFVLEDLVKGLQKQLTKY